MPAKLTVREILTVASYFLWGFGRALLAQFLALLSLIPGSSFFRPASWGPWQIENISAAWLTKKLQSTDHIGPNDKIVKIERLGLVTGGYMGIINRLKLQYASEPSKSSAPRTLIVKQSRPGFGGRVLCSLSEFVEELKFYQQLGHKVALPVPVFYYGQQFLASDVMMVMSDVTNAKPPPDPTKFTTEDTIALPILRRAVKNLAMHQAKYWDKPVLNTIPCVKNGREDTIPVALMKIGVKNTWKNFQNVCPRGWTQQTIEELIDLRAELVPYLKKHLPKCLVHGDYRLGNMLVEYTGSKVKCTVVDWQGIHKGHPFKDLAFLLIVDLPAQSEVRDKILQDLLLVYHNSIKKHGVKHLDLDTLRTYFILGILDHVVFVWLVSAPFADMSNPEAIRQFSCWFNRCMMAVEELDGVNVAKQFMKQNPL